MTKVVASGLAVADEGRFHHLAQVRHVLIGGRIEGVGQDRLVGTARQPERRWEPSSPNAGQRFRTSQRRPFPRAQTKLKLLDTKTYPRKALPRPG